MVTLDGFVPSSSPVLVEPDTGAAAGGSPSLPTLPLPVVPVAADMGADLAFLEVQAGQIQRSEATDDRNAEEKLADSEADQEVNALRSEASSMGSQAIVDGALAVVDAGGGGKSTPFGAVVSGVKGATDGLFGAAEKNDEANAKGFEAAAGAAQSGVQGAHDAVTDAEQLVQAALEFYKEYASTQAQTDLAALGRA
jgi:hypothetical protein